MKWYKLVTQSAGRRIWLIRSLTSYEGNCNDCDITVERTSRQVEWFAMILRWSCVQNRRSVLSPDWYEWFSCKRQKLHQRACRTCSTILIPHSTNQIIHLWRCRRFCRRRFVQNLWQVQLLTLRVRTLVVPLLTPHGLDIYPARALISLPGCKAVAEGVAQGELAFHLFLAYTKRIARNDPWGVWSNLHLFIANVSE